nr:hypothetical protein [Bifidobacterium dentium]
MLVLEGGTMRETMDELGHSSLTVAVNSYQRIVREHHRDTVERLAYRYLPSDDPVIRTLIARKERQIGKLRDEVERLRRILPKQDTGTPENRYTEKPIYRKTETGMTERGKRNRPAYPTRLSVTASTAATLRHRGNEHARMEMPGWIPKPVNTEK